MEFELMASMMCANYGNLEKEVRELEEGDVLLLAGKGHETYQEVNHEKRHMDEREIVADYL